MTETKAPRAKKSIEETIEALKSKQKALALKSSKLEKKLEEKKNAETNAAKLKVAKLAEAAGILNIDEKILTEAFKAIADKNLIQNKNTSTNYHDL